MADMLMERCSNCGGMMPKGAKTCVSCGMKMG